MGQSRIWSLRNGVLVEKPLTKVKYRPNEPQLTDLSLGWRRKCTCWYKLKEAR